MSTVGTPTAELPSPSCTRVVGSGVNASTWYRWPSLEPTSILPVPGTKIGVEGPGMSNEVNCQATLKERPTSSIEVTFPAVETSTRFVPAWGKTNPFTAPSPMGYDQLTVPVGAIR